MVGPLCVLLVDVVNGKDVRIVKRNIATVRLVYVLSVDMVSCEDLDIL